jgi:DDE superfamily endonuclease
MDTNTSPSPLRGWSPKGQRAYCSVPRNRGPNTTLLSSMTMQGMGPSLAAEGATTAAVFETCVELVLSAMLRPGQIVVMDNLSSHKGERVKGLIRGAGLQAVVPATLLARVRSDRGGFCQDQGHPKESRSSRPQGTDRSDRSGDVGGQR